MKNILIFIIIACFLSLKLYADNRDFVDMGVRADNGDVLYWSTGDMILLKNGEAKIANYGGFGSRFGWGDVTGKVVGEDLINYGGSNPLYEISGNRNYDIARAKLGQPYRLPTYTEIDRLHKNCSQEFVKIPRNIKGVDENGVPIWLQGQWMWQHVIHTQRGSFGGWLSVKIDGLLVNVLSSEGKTLFEGLYDYSHGILKFSDFTLYLDMDKESIRDDKGEYFKKVSSQSTLTEICGYMLTSKINGNKLFFPTPPSYSTMNAGNGVLITNNNQDLSYWSGTLYKEDLRNAVSLVFASNGWGVVAQRRYSHFRIRAVKGGSDSANSLQSSPMIVDKSNSEVSFNDKGVSNDVILPKTNSKGEYLVKSIHWVNAFTQKEVGNKGDKWYYFKYDDDGNLIEVRKEFYQNFKYKAVETFTTINNRYQFISYVNGKQVLNSKCEFTFNKQGYMDKLYIYETSGTRVTTVGTLTYYDNGELKSIDLTSEEKGGNRYKIHNYEEYTWENGNMIKYHYTNDDNITQTFDIHYGNKANNTNINLSSLIKHYNSPYNEHILFATEWCGKKPNNLISYQDMKDDTFDYIYEGNLLKKINKKNSSYSKGYYLIEYVY